MLMTVCQHAMKADQVQARAWHERPKGALRSPVTQAAA